MSRRGVLCVFNMGMENEAYSRVKRVTARAIRQMVGENADWDGPMRDLADLVIVRPEAFAHDNELTAKNRLGRTVREVAVMVKARHIPEVAECIRPDFWETETGEIVHTELRKMFDKVRAGKKVSAGS